MSKSLISHESNQQDLHISISENSRSISIAMASSAPMIEDILFLMNPPRFGSFGFDKYDFLGLCSLVLRPISLRLVIAGDVDVSRR
jgi:hypothetical protein